MSATGDIWGESHRRRCCPLRAACCVFGSLTKLVELGYLQPGARHRATAVERAIDRLRSDLVREGVICDSNLSSLPKDEDQQGLLGTQIAGALSLPKRRLSLPESLVLI